MQFEMIIYESWPVSFWGKLALTYAIIVLIALIYYAVALQVRYRRLWRYSQILGQPGLVKLKPDEWKPDGLSTWPEIREPQFIKIIEALRYDLAGKGPFSIMPAIEKGLDMLSWPFRRMVFHLSVMGWSACLMGLLGGLREMILGLRAMSLMKEASISPFLGVMAVAVFVQFLGLAVGLACFLVASLSRSRLMLIRQELSNRILTATSQLDSVDR